MPTELEVPSTPAPEEPKPAADDISSLSESWQAEIKSLRKESADRRTKLASFEKADADAKAASLTEIEREKGATAAATTRADALEAKLIMRDAMTTLDKANLIDSDLAYLAIKDKIVVEGGEATNLETLVADLVKARPHLVKNADTAAPARPTAPRTIATNPSPDSVTAARPSVAGRLFSTRN